jgi:hypothetical protein
MIHNVVNKQLADLKDLNAQPDSSQLKIKAKNVHSVNSQNVVCQLYQPKRVPVNPLDVVLDSTNLVALKKHHAVLVN